MHHVAPAPHLEIGQTECLPHCLWVQVKNEVQPIQEAEAARIKSEVAVFARRVTEYQKGFRSRSFYRYSTGAEKAYPEIDQASCPMLPLLLLLANLCCPQPDCVLVAVFSDLQSACFWHLVASFDHMSFSISTWLHEQHCTWHAKLSLSYTSCVLQTGSQRL